LPAGVAKRTKRRDDQESADASRKLAAPAAVDTLLRRLPDESVASSRSVLRGYSRVTICAEELAERRRGAAGERGVPLAAAAHAAEDAGSMVLRARGIAGESDFPFGVVRQAFELLVDGAPAVERRAWLRGPTAIVPPILNLSSHGTVGPDADPTGHVAAHALFWLTVNIARRAPLVVVVDDVRWADARRSAGSATCLGASTGFR